MFIGLLQCIVSTINKAILEFGVVHDTIIELLFRSIVKLVYEL